MVKEEGVLFMGFINETLCLHMYGGEKAQLYHSEAEN
jgi:hypothetical protein